MKHKVKVTVLDKKLYPELQHRYCADPNSGVCPCYNVGDEFVFLRDGEQDSFWQMGLGTLTYTCVYLCRFARRIYNEGLDEG